MLSTSPAHACPLLASQACHTARRPGYLPLDEGNRLLATLFTNSAVGSHIIVTVPPGPAVKAAKLRAEAAARASVAGDAGAEAEAVAPVHMGEGAGGGVSTVQANMPHVTFEEPEDTYSR